MNRALLFAVLATASDASAATASPGGICNAEKMCPTDYACVLSSTINTCQSLMTVPLTACRELADVGNPVGMKSQCGSPMNCVQLSLASSIVGQCMSPGERGDRCDYNVIGGVESTSMLCATGNLCADGFCQQAGVTEGSVCKNSENPMKSIVCGKVAGTQMYCSSTNTCTLNVEEPCGLINGAYVECTDSGKDRCVENICRPISMDGSCATSDGLPISQQSFCPGRQLCLTIKGGQRCFDDRCYDSCAAGTSCDNGMCKSDTPCEMEKNACCEPQKNILEGSTQNGLCSSVMRECVCGFDPKCCQTTLDLEDPDNSPGWDFQCVEGAKKYCMLEC